VVIGKNRTMKQIIVILCIFVVSYNFGLVKARPSPEDESDVSIDISDDVAATEDPETEDAANNETQSEVSANATDLDSDDVAATEDPETEDAASNETQWEVTVNTTNIYSDNVTATENPETDKDVSSDNKNVSSNNEDVSSDDEDVSSDNKVLCSNDTLDSDEEEDTNDFSQWRYKLKNIFSLRIKYLVQEMKRIFSVRFKKRNA
ncbi:hypothetical protein Bpfe_003777, partial [Biomphalaria pfeifferi]